MFWSLQLFISYFRYFLLPLSVTTHTSFFLFIYFWLLFESISSSSYKYKFIVVDLVEIFDILNDIICTILTVQIGLFSNDKK